MFTGRMGTRYATVEGDRHGVGVLMDYNRGRKRIATGSPHDRPISCEKKVNYNTTTNFNTLAPDSLATTGMKQDNSPTVNLTMTG